LKIARFSVPVVVLLCSGLTAFGQTVSESPADYSFTVSTSQPWTDTGVDLFAGDTLTLTAEAKSGADANCVPQGTSSSSSTEKLPLSDAPVGALIAKTNKNKVAKVKINR